jgi:hypothetical protein
LELLEEQQGIYMERVTREEMKIERGEGYLRLLLRIRKDLYGAFPVKRLFWVLLTFFCSERGRPFFVPSPAIKLAERAEGIKGPKR